jgi:cephalosporin hydroxylase
MSELKQLTLADCPVPILQHGWEWQQFIKIYELHKPKNILEIGSFYGGTLWFYMNANNANLKSIMSIDLPVPPSDDRYGEMLKCRTLWPGWEEQRGVAIYDIQGNSQGELAIRGASSIFKDDPVDLLFIDGDHSYQGVKADYENYEKLVRPGGMIVFHDCHGLFDVKRFWQEVKATKPCLDIELGIFDEQRFWDEVKKDCPCIEIKCGDGWGIGILFKQ